MVELIPYKLRIKTDLKNSETSTELGLYLMDHFSAIENPTCDGKNYEVTIIKIGPNDGRRLVFEGVRKVIEKSGLVNSINQIPIN